MNSIFRTYLVLAISLLVACSSAETDSESDSMLRSPASVSYGPYAGTCASNNVFCVYFSPNDMPIHIIGEYLKKAKRSIRIATYNMDVEYYEDILQALLDKNKKLNIEFMVDYKLSFDANLVWRTLQPQTRVTKYRVPVMRGGNPQMHNKIILIDDEVVLFGSANWTYSGLVANYENTLAIRDTETIRKFNAQLDQLRETAQFACSTFAQNKTKCGQGTETWDPDFDILLKTGYVSPKVLKPDPPPCAGLTQSEKNRPDGIFDAGNQPLFPKIDNCFSDSRYPLLIDHISKRARYEDGTLIHQDPDTKKHKHNQNGPIKVYFSPQDNVEDVILTELKSTYMKGDKEDAARAKDSFAYISTNFITNKKIAETLLKMKEKKVRMKIFFDRGRAEDEKFNVAKPILDKIGFTKGDEEGKLITIFDNATTGPYGANHNKLAVVGTPESLKVLTGSTNWSTGAMNDNDENYVVIENDELAAIYLREILSELYVYRYSQKLESAGFQDDLKFITKKVPCVAVLLGEKGVSGCPGWNPIPQAFALLSVDHVPADPNTNSMWAWSPTLEMGLQLFTHHVFAGRWLTVVPISPGKTLAYKFLITPKEEVPSKNNLKPSFNWEFDGVHNRSITLPNMALQKIEGHYKWGDPNAK